MQNSNNIDMNQQPPQQIGDKYEIVSQLPQYKKGIDQYICKNLQKNEKEYLSMHFNKQKLKFQNLKVTKIKHLNILKPLDWYNQQKEYVLFYDKVLLDQLRASQQQVHKQIIKEANKNQILLQRIVLQLCFVMRELQERGLAWNYLLLSHLYFIDEFVMLDVSQFDFDASPNTVQSYLNFKRNILQQYFSSDFVQELDQCKNFIEITQKAIEMTQIIQPKFKEPPFRYILQLILGTSSNDETVISNNFANAVVYKMKTPNLFRSQGVNSEEIAVKSTLIKGDNQEELKFIKKNIQTELDLMEQLSVQQDQFFCSCISFFRFWDQVYLFSPFYKKTLQVYFNEIEENEGSKDQLNPSIVLKLAHQFAQALEQLHNFNIIHRDLKPDNLFLTENMINDPKQQLIIADFDRSKSITLPQVLNHQTDDQFTDFYRPPDEDPNQFSFDVWQFGVICYQLACKGDRQYLSRNSQILDDTEYKEKYGENKIRENMLKYNNYKDEFIQLIADCLDQNPEKRPSSQNLCQIMKNIKSPIVQVIDIEYSQSYGKNCFSCW